MIQSTTPTWSMDKKNHSGGVSDLSNGKTVTIVHSQGNRSHTMLLDLYLSKIPNEAKQATNRFYLKPYHLRQLEFIHGFGIHPLEQKKNPNHDEGYDRVGQNSRKFSQITA